MPVTQVEINLEIICLYMTNMYRNIHIHTHTKKETKSVSPQNISGKLGCSIQVQKVEIK